MNRRDALKTFTMAVGAATVPILRPRYEYLELPLDDRDILKHLERLRGEPKAASAVRIERGGPRLFVNGKEEYPLLAGSSGLIHTIKSFKASGVKFFHAFICTHQPGGKMLIRKSWFNTDSLSTKRSTRWAR